MKNEQIFFSTNIISDMGDKHHIDVKTFHGASGKIIYHCTIDNDYSLDIQYLDVDKWEDVIDGETPMASKIGAIIEAFSE